jgi:hypothetical protein
MKSLIVPLRVKADENAKLREMALESETGAEGVGDFLRLLIHREWNRGKDYRNQNRKTGRGYIAWPESAKRPQLWLNNFDSKSESQHAERHRRIVPVVRSTTRGKTK